VLLEHGQVARLDPGRLGDLAGHLAQLASVGAQRVDALLGTA
jgi:hypothetical protein